MGSLLCVGSREGSKNRPSPTMVNVAVEVDRLGAVNLAAGGQGAAAACSIVLGALGGVGRRSVFAAATNGLVRKRHSVRCGLFSPSSSSEAPQTICSSD